VNRGDTIMLSLPESPTTGYRWALDQPNTGIVTLQNSTYATASGSAIGGGGRRTMVFQTSAPGTARIDLKLYREWAGDASITKRFSITVNVQ
jgi:inhibitor of cysteine peptidase